MSDRLRSLLWIGGMAILAIVLASLVLTAESEADRVESLGQIIKCPVCQGEAIGDSPASMATDMMDLVRERVAEGRTDTEIVDELLSSYSGAVLLDPPASGSTLPLWLAPLLALMVGLAVIAWWKSHPSSPNSRPDEADHRSTNRPVTLALLGLALVAIVVVAAQFVQDRPSPASGAVATDASDLEDVSNETLEAVIASNLDNPQIDGMRLALAERYFDLADYHRAFPHYLAVAESVAADPEQVLTALVRLGWMAWDGNGEATTAVGLFDQALTIDPSSTVARYLKGQVLVCGTDRRDEGVNILTALLEDDISDESRSQIESDLAQIPAGTFCS